MPSCPLISKLIYILKKKKKKKKKTQTSRVQSQNNLEHKECKIKANTHLEGVKSKQIQI